MKKNTQSKFKKYGQSEQGNFKVIDSIGVPHPYCITPKHLEYGDSMYLNADSIRHAEEKGAVCDICRKRYNKTFEPILPYDKHEQALIVACKQEIKDNEELKQYLLKIKDKAEADDYAGFAFVKK